MKEFGTGLVTVILAIIGVAVIAVIVSKNANTTGVVSASGNAFTSALGCALSPVTGGACASSNSLTPFVNSTFTPL